MKKVKKKVELQLEEVTREPFTTCEWRDPYRGKVTYKFSTFVPIPNMETLEHYVEVEIPETIKEFCTLHKTTKKSLVEWLNKNYK